MKHTFCATDVTTYFLFMIELFGITQSSLSKFFYRNVADSLEIQRQDQLHTSFIC